MRLGINADGFGWHGMDTRDPPPQNTSGNN
jgi:hypothetical protein